MTAPRSRRPSTGLGGFIGQRVRVGGRVTSVDGPMASISDGTGETSLRFVSAVDAAAVALAPDELVNVTGWDAERDVGGLEVVVTAVSDVSRAPAFGDGGSGPEPTRAIRATASPGLRATEATWRVRDRRTAEPARGIGLPVAVGLLAAFAAAALMLVAGSATYVAASPVAIGGNVTPGRPPRLGLEPAASPNPPPRPGRRQTQPSPRTPSGRSRGRDGPDATP